MRSVSAPFGRRAIAWLIAVATVVATALAFTPAANAAQPAKPHTAGNPPAAGVFNPLAPSRICDTRASQPANQCTGHTLASQGTLTVGVPAVQANATAAVVNVTVTNTQNQGFLQVFPTGGSSSALTSVVNFTGGQTVANSITAQLGTGNSISIFNGGNPGGSTDVVVDLQGFYAPPPSASVAGQYHPLPPARTADTRCATNPSSPFCAAIPGVNFNLPTIGPGATDNVQITGTAGVPASGVSAVIVNVGVTNTTAPSFLTAFPTGQSRPVVSNQNWVANETLSSKAVIPVGSGGQISLYNQFGSTDAVVDVDGYFSDAGGTAGNFFTPMNPVRVIGNNSGGVVVPSGNSAFATIAGANGVPANATAGALNLTDVQPAQGNFLTSYPAGQAPPLATDVNFVPSNTYNVVPNAAYTKVGTGGQVGVLNGPSGGGPTTVIADLFGFYTPSTPAGNTVTVSANPSSIPADGTSTSTVTATVNGPSGPVVGDPVNFTTSGTACGTLSGSTSPTNPSGQATVTYTSSTTVGTCSVTATEANQGQSGSTTINQTQVGNQVTVTPASSTVPADGTTTDSVLAHVTGVSGPVSGDTVTFSTSGGAACGPVSPSSGVTDVAGNVSTTYTASHTSGFCTITAHEANTGADGQTTIDQTTFPPTTTNTVGVVANPASIPANGTSHSTVTATVTNGATPVVGDPVVLTLSGPPGVCGSISPTSGTTNSSGQVTGIYTSTTTAGTCTVTAKEANTAASGSTGIAQTVVVNSVAVSANPSALAANGTSTSTVTATVTGVSGPVSGDTVSFTTSGGPACGPITPSGTTNASGQANATYTASTTSGFCTITATELDTGGHGNTTITQTQTAPATVSVSANPPSIAADGTSHSTVTVTVSNGSGPVPGDPVNLTTSGAACGTLVPSTGTTNGSGQLTSTYTSTTTVGTCTVTATEAFQGQSGSTSITQTQVTNTVTLTPATSSVPADGHTTDAMTAHVTGIGATPVAGDTVTFTTSGGAACGPVSPTSGVTDVSGNVTTTYTASLTSGFCTVTAHEANTGGNASTTIDQTSFPPPLGTNTIGVVANPVSVPADGHSTSSVTVTVKDPTNTTPVSGDPVVLSTSGGSVCGPLSPTSGTTNASGQVTVTYTATTTVGTCTVTAKEANTGNTASTGIAQTLVHNTVGVSANPSTIPANGTATSTVTATVTGVSGPVSNDPVAWSISGDCGSVFPANSFTNGSGQDTTTYTAVSTPPGAGFCTVTAVEAATGGQGSTTITQTST
jgi:adhesin/invasin